MNNLELLNKIQLANKIHKSGNSVEAEKIYQELFTLNKNSFELVYSYALFCRDLRNFKLAKQLLLNLINKFPLFINPYIVISEMLRIENKFQDAEKMLLKANKIDPNNGDLLYNLAIYYFSIKNYEYALNYINKAIKLSNLIDIYKILKAEIFINQNKLDEALKILYDFKDKKNNKKIRIKVLISNIFIKKKKFNKSEEILLDLIREFNLQLAYLNLSSLYSSKNELKKAIKLLKKGIKSYPEYMPFYKNLATFYRNTGQIKLAIDANLFILSKNKFDYSSYYELSEMYNFNKHNNELNLLLNTNLNDLNPFGKIKAAFAISNIYHKQREYNKSSFYLKIANDESLKQSMSDYELKIKNAEFFKSLNIKKSKFIKSKKHNSHIFIVGMPRSGSTLLENILSLNDDANDMGEVNFLEESLKEIKNIEEVYSTYSKKIIEQFEPFPAYTDKNLFNYMYCSIISNYFPNAKIIHCIRNPLDNILSIYRANFLNQPFSFSLNDISNLYVHHYEIMEYYKKNFGEIIFEYNYEDLVENPNDIISKIINWLGWKWDEKYLSPHKNKRNVSTASSAQIRNKINSSSIGIWKEYKELMEPAIEIIKTNKSLSQKF
tara:strand:- start:454 stop:2274 length:1821 start_codon:yes stop_codon:yes gene_type:complete